jgi:hypothetical protein
MRNFRSIRLSLASLLLVLLTIPQPTHAYSVLTHEQIIDLTWTDSIKPVLLRRYPNLTPAQLREARAYAYGGCVIQDLGYYPMGRALFSDLLHYVRTGDFIRALFRDAKSPDDLAFAIGALSHYMGDTIGHAEAINLAVGTEFPALAVKFGPNVNYAEGPHQHVRAEFAFDINEITKHRLAPEGYLNHIGFAVPVPLLARAYYDTYGLDIAGVLGHHRPTLRGYRYSVRTLLPHVAYAETLLHGKHMPADTPGPALDLLNQEIATLATLDHWDSYRGHAGLGTHLLAGFIFLLPKVGPLSDLSVRGPTVQAEQDYVNSLDHTVDAFRQMLAHASTTSGLANQDLDTGYAIRPGTYRLCDSTYADLLHEVTSTPTTPIPFGLKRDLLAYFADPEKATYLKREPQKFARMKAELPILTTISTHAEYPDTAFLPEPDEDAAPNPQPGSSTPASAQPATPAPPNSQPTSATPANPQPASPTTPNP